MATDLDELVAGVNELEAQEGAAPAVPTATNALATSQLTDARKPTAANESNVAVL